MTQAPGAGTALPDELLRPPVGEQRQVEATELLGVREQLDLDDLPDLDAAQVLDLAGAGPAEPQPALLYRVVRLGGRAEHPVGHRSQAGTVGFEPLFQHVVLVHCHTFGAGSVIEVTHPTASM